MTEERNYLKSLTQGERLLFLIKRYFNSQTEFANLIKINDRLINKYCNGSTQKVSIKSLTTMENTIGVNSQFILTGEGEEFIEGYS